MPHLDRMRQEAFRSEVESVTDLSSGSIWPTFFTGVNPGRHGQFFTHMQIEPGTYRIVKKYADDVPFDPFWKDLHRAGRSAAVIDVPQTRPIETVEGIQISGWGGEYPAWPRSSSPAQLMPEIVKRFGRHPLAGRYRVALRPEKEKDLRRLAHELLHGTRAKADLSRWIFEKGPHDLFLTVFSETHWGQHLLWDLLDATHPLHDPAIVSESADLFREMLGTIDDMIGALRAASPESDFLVFSLSGMGRNCSGWHVLPEILERLGFGPEREKRGRLGASRPRRFLPSRWQSAAGRLVPVGAIEAAKAIVPERWWDSWTRRILYGGSGWSESRAFCVPNDYSGAIRINRKGREPNGKVAPGAEYDAACDAIAEALLELEHVETGRPLVRRVVRTSDMCSGERMAALPDLLVLWSEGEPVTGARSSRIGTIRLDPPERRTGAHRPRGFLVASGRNISTGSPPEPVHILDLAPTILHRLGVEAPTRYEGRIVPALQAGSGSAGPGTL